MTRPEQWKRDDAHDEPTVIRVLVRPEEREMIQLAARRHGLPTSTYMRRVTLDAAQTDLGRQ